MLIVGQVRPEFIESPITKGKEISIKLPNGEARDAQFALVELDQLVPSHNYRTFASSEGYPLTETGHNINDRNYSGDQAAQGAVINYAQNLDPTLLITTSRTPDGTPIINIFLARQLRFINTPHPKKVSKTINHNIIQIILMTSNLYLMFYKEV